MEWAPDSTGTVVEFNDDATFAFVNRYMEDDAVPQYTVTKTEDNGVSIKTDYLTVLFICMGFVKSTGFRWSNLIQQKS